MQVVVLFTIMTTVEQALSEADRSADNVPRVITALADYYGLTDQALAELVGTPRSTVRTKKKGTHSLTDRELARFSVALGVPKEVFYLDPDHALRWVLDHAEARPEWLVSILAERRSGSPLDLVAVGF